MKRETILAAAAEAAYNAGAAIARAEADGAAQFGWSDLRPQDQAALVTWTEAILTGLRQPDPAATHEVARAAVARAVATALRFEVAGPQGPDRILAATARSFGVTLEQIRGKATVRHIALARHVAMFLCCRAGFSLEATGRLCGHRDHTTALGGRKRIAALLAADLPADRVVRAKILALGALLEIEVTVAPSAPVVEAVA